MTATDDRLSTLLGRWVAGVGLFFIAAMAGLSAYDIVHSQREAVAEIGRDLQRQARVTAEQTARSLQAVDVVLRNVAAESRATDLRRRPADQLHDYLKNQALGLVQAEGLALFDAGADRYASSAMARMPLPLVNFAADPVYQLLRAGPRDTPVLATVRPGALTTGSWFLPVVRRLETADGRFAGVVAASVRVAYFQDFFQEIAPEADAAITVVHDDGHLVARHPLAEPALGRPWTAFAALQTAWAGRTLLAARAAAPSDGRDQFGVRAAVPDYPLSIVITRDAERALAPWRERTRGTVLRTGTLVAVALVLLALLQRQLRRLAATRASLQLSRERFALAAAGSEEGIWDWNLVTDEMYGSPRARQIFGLRPGPDHVRLADWRSEVRVHPDDDETRRSELAAHIAGHTPVYACEYRVRSSDGPWRWVRVRGLCERDATGRALRMAGSVTDIDAQKQTEEALRRSEERYQLAVAGSDQGLWDWDLASDQLFLSPRAQQLFWPDSGEPQRPRRDWIARTPYHPDDVAPVRRAIADYLQGRTRGFNVEYRVRHHGGAWHWYRQRGIAVRDAAGRPTRMAGSIEDISDRKNADIARDHLESQLRQAQKLEAIGTLAGGIAHDFNNILAAILGYGEMALKDAPEGSAQRRHIDAAVSAGLRAKSLVERILAFSRSGIGERVPVHVQSVVQEALDQLQASTPAGLHVERRLDVGDTAVLGDPTQVHQVVMNLCANAVQAMRSQGKVIVTLDRVRDGQPVCITGRLPAGDYVRLRVSDSGVGITPEVLERIFDPFFTTKGVGVGTGLGLSLVHGIVTDLGGGIDVQSEPGVGSTFTVYLPSQSSIAPPARETTAVPSGRGETVLLVDDEEALVRLGEELVAELGYEPVGYTSSRAALDAYRADPARFDVVLSDDAMPELTGSELALAVRQLRGDLPIVLMSGLVTPALTLRAREAGVTEVLAKPLVARDIARALAAALGRA
ncbi:PAS domain-containing protein [Rubrivivax sp. RP6-9]|uniref:PAS domain-containing protein n=1 Tax=Rubrivivax sp. RP6-9 TaxID=3415750 RepID=UPI003CC505DF